MIVKEINKREITLTKR